jgi:methyl-accepting chemotaxis protein
MLVFLVSILVSGVALSRVLNQKAQDEISSQALIMIQTMDAVRNYTQQHVNPLLTSKLETEPKFLAETVPAFSATEVFENLRKNKEYKNFLYKEATLNPTNMRDKADDFESELISQFRRLPETKQLSGFRNADEGQIFYIARPLVVKHPDCLQCHSTPDRAPKSQIATYGSESGMGWQLNQIIATQIVSVPAEEVFANARRTFSLVMIIMSTIFIIVTILINLLVRKAIIQRIKKISKVAQKASMGEMSAEFDETSNDEIGGLSAAFSRMKSSLEIAIKLLKEQKRSNSEGGRFTL